MPLFCLTARSKAGAGGEETDAPGDPAPQEEQDTTAVGPARPTDSEARAAVSDTFGAETGSKAVGKFLANPVDMI